MHIDTLILKAVEHGKRNRLSSANSSFSSYDCGEDQDENDKWLNPDADKMSDKSNYSAMVNGVIFDDKYEFLDRPILGEVSSSTVVTDKFSYLGVLFSCQSLHIKRERFRQ